MKQFSLKRLLKEHPEYWYVLFVPAFLLCFGLVERLVPSDGDYWASYLPMDDRIPFLEVFVVPYCMWYPLLVFTGLGLMLTDVPEFKRYMRFLILGFGLSLLICVLFPNGQDLRPDPFPRENFFTWVLGGIYAADTNTNVLPSMHVVGCVAALCGVFRTRSRLRRWRWGVLGVCLLICASTVLVKQHSVLDILAALGICIPIWFAVYGNRRKRA